MAGDAPREFRTLFISDIHLGSKAAKAEFLLDFLRDHDAETIYLVGDIVDGWRLRRSWHWPQSHNDVVQKLLRKGRKGARIIYIAGNHDEFLRSFQGTHFGGIEVADRDHAQDRRRPHLPGHPWRPVRRHRPQCALARLSRRQGLRLRDRRQSHRQRLRRLFGMPYWSFSSWAKVKVKKAVKFISHFQKIVVEEARRSGVDGVICGHIHHAAIEHMDGIEYINTGDWVESCTAVVEHFDGRMEIIRFTELAAKPNPCSRALRARLVEGNAAAA